MIAQADKRKMRAPDPQLIVDTHALTGVALKATDSGFARPASSMPGTALIPALTERGVPAGLN